MSVNRFQSLLTISFLIFCGCGGGISGDPKIVNVVKDGHFDESHFLFGGSDINFKSKTIGEAFDNFFGSPSWNGFVSDAGDKIAEFEGKAELMGNTVKVEFQFKISDDGTFDVGYFGIDGESAPQLIGEGLIGKVFE